jgi:8-oxo-dGTP diphosphatase
LLRRFNTGYMDGHYSLPAGHLKNNESITHALIREVKEEAGISLKPKNINLAHVMHRREEDIRVDLFFTTTAYQGKPKNTEPEKCDDLSWFPLNELPKNTIPYIRQALNCYLNHHIYSEIGWG